MSCLVATVFTSILTLTFPEPPETIATLSGKVVSVADGDTLTVLVDRKQVKVRLEGIDAPERSQAFGAKSKDALTELVAGKVVTVHKTGEDRYGRTLARVHLDSEEINSLMVARGFAWHYKQYSKDKTLAELEDKARSERVGLWADARPVPPWEFRRNAEK